ncbi:galactose mutarotase [Acetobacteraceae bacterium KSS8]|uniref:Aldose 1-epimerase n=1 Tax=Endosaccharibacter trunci TaxID=2812733 RepID=A0ABT1W6Q2_9PROT|nr:galactose mutarotase [Acetobacteraceae bacterium KSS8]
MVRSPSADISPFGTLPDGAAVTSVILRNGSGLEARVLSFGATLQALHVPDRTGRSADIVLGYATASDYQTKPQYFGATIGRFGNRIGGGRFSLDGRAYRIPATDGAEALHGGERGFDVRLWEIDSVSEPGEPASVTLRRVSPDGEEGFPGTLEVRATYSLGEDGLELSYEASTDAPTVINLTNHSFFNLSGEASGRSALEHRLTLQADRITAVGPTMIPTGVLMPVDGTALDFRAPRRIADRVRDASEQQIALGRGYDHNYVLRDAPAESPLPAARLEDPVSGRVLEVLTTEPGVQFYSGNFLDGTIAGKSGLLYRQDDGLCLETQHFPDSPNHPHFPSTRLDPGRVFRSRTVWRFSTMPA